MSEALENQLGNALARAWSEAAPAVLGSASTLSLSALKEASGADIPAALELTPTFPSAFVAPCSGALSGVLVYLFKKEDRQQMELFISKTTGSDGPAGIMALIKATLTTTATGWPEPTSFGEVAPIDFSTTDPAAIIAQLSTALGNALWVNSFTLTVGERLNTQMLVLYAPRGAVEALLSAEFAATTTAAAAAGSSNSPKRRTQREDPARNIERLLDVELEVVVRFGLTQIPLRELVRIGVGSMIELNRQVDEPVELLVNNRSLARGTVVVVDGYYGVCITEIGQPEERRQSLTKI